MTAADPSAVLVPPRLLGRVVRRDRGLTFFGPSVRVTTYVLSGRSFGSILGGSEPGRSRREPWPETVLLVAGPEPGELEDTPSPLILLETWRRLFRARVQAEVQRSIDSGAIDGRGLAARIEAVGRTEFEEARTVLAQDGALLPPHTDAAAYQAFAAAFLDLTFFAPGMRAYTFPAIEDPSAVVALLAADVDGEKWFAATRLAGAPDPAPTPAPTGPEPGRAELEAPLTSSAARRSADHARAAGERGNAARAAILWTQAAGEDGTEAVKAARASARAALKNLASRLQKAVFLRKGEAELWAEALTPLLRRAARGFWTPEARLLYDLQKVCIDHEREVFRIDLVGWTLSMGRRPLKRPMPHLREVTVSNHLRGAARRLPRVRLSRQERARLEGLLRPTVHRAEQALRDRFRPVIDATLGETWVEPRNLAERVAFRKLVEELLDGIVGRGFTTLGDLRDAASRGNLKLPDVAGPAEFLRGDRLLAADRALAGRLEGVHRRGEVYLRWLQRFSALAFGTPLGRLLTLYVALPYGGSYVSLRGLQELDELAVSRLTGHPVHLIHAWSLLVLGSLALGAINFARFRRQIVAVLAALGRSLRAVFVDLPALLLNAPILLKVLSSTAAAAVWRLVFKPGLFAVPFGVAARRLGFGPAAVGSTCAAAFAGAGFVFNTGTGRALEDAFADAIGRTWRGLAFDLVPGLFRLVMSAFERVLEWVEKLIYAVDEWLRFRRGQSRLVLGAKAVLGLVWAVLAYLIRIYVNLLIEPQVNPIKHFPVVTVSHKVILPMSLKITPVFEAALAPVLGKGLSYVVAWSTVFLLPGVFGFLVWELKSNWRLYEANRPRALGAVVVGGHGETVVGLLHPGFHSGTLPKAFARIRRPRRGGRDSSALRRREALHHVEESVRRFVDRDFAALLRESRALGDLGLESRAIRLATNRIRVEFLAVTGEGPALRIDFVERSGVLVAWVSPDDWLAGLRDEQWWALDGAVNGLFKMSGVQVVSAPGHLEPAPAPDGPRLSTIRFADVVLTWQAWVARWEAGQAGDGPPVDDAGWPAVLPSPESSRGR